MKKITPVTALKDVDRKDVVEVEALDEEPVKHRRAAVLQQNVEALAKVRLKVEEYISLGQKSGTAACTCSSLDKYVNSRYRRCTYSQVQLSSVVGTVINVRGSDAFVL